MSHRYYEDHGDYSLEQRKVYGSYNGGIEERKPASFLQHDEYRPLPTSARQQTSQVENYVYMSGCQSCLEGVVRPLIAEFCAVFVSIFLTAHIDAELADRHVSGVHRITMVAFIDAVTATLFISSFKTVHLHPFVTLSNLFTLTTSWTLCLLVFLVQVVASTLAIGAIAVQKPNGLPPKRSLDYDVNTEWNSALYRLMLTQFLGTALVVVAYLMCHVCKRMGKRRVAFLVEAPTGIFMAIFLNSFLSLLHSTQNWNPLLSSGISFIRIFGPETSEPFFGFFKFWLGPAVGALLSSFLYRLLYAPDDRRLMHCFEPKETHIF